jgi:undecaprenyl diphosphate synthase
MNPLNHVAIIMDGNGRWGIKKKNNRNYGHQKGLDVVENIIKESIKLKIKYLTFFTFSTENWKRPKKEIIFLFDLLENFLKKKINKLNKNNIKIKILGEKVFSKKLNKLLNFSEKKTIKNTKIQINLALNYGSKLEIIRAFNLLKNKKRINENDLVSKLYTHDMPDPDILIRTGGTRRLSNFLLWQIAYSEIYFVKKLWPDFNIKDYNRIIKNFRSIKRNFGSIQ